MLCTSLRDVDYHGLIIAFLYMALPDLKQLIFLDDLGYLQIVYQRTQIFTSDLWLAVLNITQAKHV